MRLRSRSTNRSLTRPGKTYCASIGAVRRSAPLSWDVPPVSSAEEVIGGLNDVEFVDPSGRSLVPSKTVD